MQSFETQHSNCHLQLHSHEKYIIQEILSEKQTESEF
jgi:hypothetical protein